MDATIIETLDTLASMEKQLAFSEYLHDIDEDVRNEQGRPLVTIERF